jgi:hypothetical protein
LNQPDENFQRIFLSKAEVIVTTLDKKRGGAVNCAEAVGRGGKGAEIGAIVRQNSGQITNPRPVI